MAGETWGSMQTDLQTLKASLATPNTVRSLKELCLAKIVDHIEYFCKAPDDPRESLAALINLQIHDLYQKHLEGKFCFVDMVQDFDVFLHATQEPFKDLSPAVMADLQLSLQTAGVSATARVLPCLVEGNTRRLSVGQGVAAWSQRDRNALLARIRDKGQNILEFEIVGEGKVGNRLLEDTALNLVLLRSMFQSLTKLTKIKLITKYFDDSDLAAIGSSCPDLRSLETTQDCSFTSVTDKGIRYLCDSSLPRGPSGEEYGRCKKLTYIEMDSTRLSPYGTVVALTNLPDLVHFNVENLFPGLLEFVENNKSIKLKLQYLKVSVDEADYALGMPITNNSAASVIAAIPDIRQLEFDNVSVTNINQFYKLKNVEALRFAKVNFMSPPGLESLATYLSHQLTNLSIDDDENGIDISTIGYHCRHLTRLYLDCHCILNTNYKLVPSVHFNKLENVEMELYVGELTFKIPQLALLCFLCSPHLQSFSLSDYKVKDTVFMSLIRKARKNSKILSNLRDLSLSCKISSLSAKQIVCLAPKLKTLVLKRKVGRSVKEFLQQHELNHVKVEQYQAQF